MAGMAHKRDTWVHTVSVYSNYGRNGAHKDTWVHTVSV